MSKAFHLSILTFIPESDQAYGRSGLDRNWALYPCCATSGDGIEEGFKWLLENIGVKVHQEEVKGALENEEY